MRQNFQARTETGKKNKFPVQLTTSRIGNHVWLNYTILCYCISDDYIYIHTPTIISPHREGTGGDATGGSFAYLVDATTFPYECPGLRGVAWSVLLERQDLSRIPASLLISWRIFSAPCFFHPTIFNFDLPHYCIPLYTGNITQTLESLSLHAIYSLFSSHAFSASLHPREFRRWFALNNHPSLSCG